MIIDSHQHFLDFSRFDYPWAEDGPLAKNWSPDNLRPLLEKTGVEKTVVVQAHKSVKEALWLLELADAHDFIVGISGWVDLVDPNLPKVLDELQKNPLFKGVRHTWEEEKDAGWLARKEIINGLKEVQARGLCYDFLVRPHNLQFIPLIMEQVPRLQAVVDHIAKPDIKNGMVEPWLSDMRAVASIDGMRCKLSGMVTEADRESWETEDLAPYFHHVLGMFGSDRIMFGSDWPVCTLAATYEQVVKTVEYLLEGMDNQDKANIWCNTATDFYGLK